MTTRELIYNVNLKTSPFLSRVGVELSTEDILYYLNEAQSQYIDEFAKNFEVNQIVIDKIQSIVKSKEITPTRVDTTFITSLPNDYKYLVRHKAITITGNKVKTVVGRQVKSDHIELQTLNNPFTEPIGKEPLYIIQDNTIRYEVPKDNFTISKTIISYIKKETPIQLVPDVTSELEGAHDEIVELACSNILNKYNFSQK